MHSNSEPVLEEKRLNRFSLKLLPVAVALGGLAGTLQLCDVLVARERAQLQRRTEAEAKHVVGQLQTGLLQRFDPLQRLGAWWLSQGRPLAPEDWQNDAQLFLSASAGLKQVTWIGAKGGSFWSVRPGAVPKVFRRPTPELTDLVATARRLNSIVISSLFSGDDGRQALYVCAPISRWGRIAGYVVGLYTVSELLDSIVDNQLPNDFSVLIAAEGRSIHSFNAPGQQPWAKGARTADIRLPNAAWSARIVPSEADIVSLRRLAMSFGFLVTGLLYVCTAIGSVSRRRATALQLANQALQWEIGERQRTEEKVAGLNRDLQRRLVDFQTLIDVIPVGIAVSDDPQCRHIWINPVLAKMMGVLQEQNISKTGPDRDKLQYKLCRDDKEVPGEELPMQVAARTGAEVIGAELDIVRADGLVINTLSFSAPLFDENGGVRGVLNACVDVTERKRLEQKLFEKQRLESIGLLAGGIAHDFNNLLGAIMGNASLVQSRLGEGDANLAQLQSVLDAAQRGADLTRQLLAYAGKGKFVIEPVDLSALARNISSLLRTSISKTIHLELDLGEGLPVIEMDPGQIQQVIMNLVINAAEAIGAEQSGTVRIATRVQEFHERHMGDDFKSEVTLDRCYGLAPRAHPRLRGRYVLLEISDTGCGMDDPTRLRIFDPFFTTKSTGRGLGLSAVSGIVRSHNGILHVDSSPGLGTTFRIWLPAAENRATAAAVSEPGKSCRGRGTILVVDDEGMIRQMTKAILEHHGYTVLLAEDGPAAVDALARHCDRVSLVLLDLTMPVMSGQETLTRLKAIRLDVPVIMSSGYGADDVVQQLKTQGATAFIQKPYTGPQLTHLIHQILEVPMSPESVGARTAFDSTRSDALERNRCTRG